MAEIFGWTRRMVLAAKTAIVGGLALPVSASVGAAAVSSRAAPQRPVAPARWPTATADELQPFVGQRFRVRTEEHGTLVLRLVDVVSPASDAARPAHLKRRAGVLATFDGPDAQLLAASEDSIRTLSHPKIGRIQAYLKTLPLSGGGFEIEMVLN